MSAPREHRFGNESGEAMRTSMRLSRHEDDEEEDYALSAMGISDGFRPSNAAVNNNRMSSQASRRDSTGRRTPPPRPSSMTKPRVLDSFALRHDGSTGPSRLTGTTVPSNDHTVDRTSTASSNMPMIVAESPYQGPSGPSHPYHMYPQGTRPVRTASVATASTFQPSERSYVGPSGPAHPYGMYPQDTNAGIETPVPNAAIPVGFPGRRDEYQRRLGPDGEEAGDIIGPMGHTEQLPPYSQYPTESFGKPLRGIPLVPGAGGMGLATRDPEFASREDLGSPNSRQSTRSMTSDLSSHDLNLGAVRESEKPLEKKGWKRIARKRLCGIVPVWAIALAALVFLLFLIVLGTVLHTLAEKHHPPSHHNASDSSATTAGEANGQYTTVTTTLDASALSSAPTGIPTLPVGTYALPIVSPYTTQQTCLDTSSHYIAWSCQLPMAMLQVTVARTSSNADSTNNNNIRITKSSDTLQTWFYGAQPPIISTQQTMSLVKDLEEPQFGPAWFFQTTYDKVVVVLENTFTAPQKRQTKRDQDESIYGNFQRKGVAQPGEKPWFCYWNGTLLETFIYVNNTSLGGTSSSAASTTAAPTSTSNPSGTASATATTDSFSPPSFLPPYPKIIKVEERRIPTSVQPYCNQMVIQSDGTAKPNLNADGNVIRIQLNATESSSQSTSKRDQGLGLVGELERRQSNQQCLCVWLTS